MAAVNSRRGASLFPKAPLPSPPLSTAGGPGPSLPPEGSRASERLKAGDRNAPFPIGCFPPALPFVGG